MVAPLSIDQFVNAGHITGEKIFSTHFGSGKNFIDFGPPRTENMSNQFELISVNADGGYFWAATPVGLRIGEAGQSKEYKLEGM